MIWVGVNLGGRQKKENYISATKTMSVHGKDTNVLLHSICCVPQNTEVEAGSGTRECRQKEVRPAPHGLLAHPDCSASALRSQFLHSLGELPGRSKPRVSILENFTLSVFRNANRDQVTCLTLRPLRKTHAQPTHAALAADTGGPGAEGVERDGSDDQGQVQGQVYCPRYVDIDLP